ncbi:hypothetical protein [Mucilaginibacter sp.]
MLYHHRWLFIGIFLIALAFGSGCIRNKMFDRSMRIIFILTGINLVEECVAFYCTIRFHQNIPVLRAYSLIEIVFISLYFNYSVHWLHARNGGFFIAGFSFLFGIADLLFYQTIYQLSDLFMFYEGTAILSMAFFALFQMIKNHNYLDITSVPHFWIAFALIIYWSFAIFNLAFYNFISKMAPTYIIWVNHSFYAINYLYSLAIALIFFLYPKMKPNV